MTVTRALYSLIILPLLYLLFHVGKFVNAKVRRGVEGRAGLFTRLPEQAAKLSGTQRLWFHASSLGEFEQAKPIIAAVKERHPSVEIIATFFSPSGYDNSKNYKLASLISYLPFDTAANMQRFVDITRPTAAIILRYDVWPNMVWTLHDRSIPVLIVNATMTARSPRLSAVARGFHRRLYDLFSAILTVSAADAAAFALFGTSTPLIAPVGDTRFDQVKRRSDDARMKQILPPAVTAGRKVFIVGQSWGEDESVLLPVLFKLQTEEPSLITIIVPHEPTVEHLDELESALEGRCRSIRFSEMSRYAGEPVILIDSIGILVALYQYAHVVYVGGSFRQGVHNVLEPAVFGVPVLFGPRHTNSQEAVELARLGGAFVVTGERSAYRTLRTLLDDAPQREKAGETARTFVAANCGATDRFLLHLQPLLER